MIIARDFLFTCVYNLNKTPEIVPWADKTLPHYVTETFVELFLSVLYESQFSVYCMSGSDVSVLRGNKKSLIYFNVYDMLALGFRVRNWSQKSYVFWGGVFDLGIHQILFDNDLVSGGNVQCFGVSGVAS